MDKHSLGIYVSTFTIALLHTMIPSHWLCFVVVGRARGWRARRTMGVAAAAGLVHVAMTVLLGLGVAYLGERTLSHETFEKASAAVLMGMGIVYLLLHFARVGHHHEEDEHVSSRWAIASLVLIVTVSPCTAAIPILVAVAATSAVAVVLLAAVLVVATVGSMLLLVGLTSLGVEKLQFRTFERYEKLILGLVLLAFGGAIFAGLH